MGPNRATHNLILLATAVALTACTDSSPTAAPAKERREAAAVTQPTAPAAQRVDLREPTFSHPLDVHNPLFPIADLHSAVLLGNDEGHLLKIETTLLPTPKVITVKGKRTKTLVSQFISYLDGRIHEVALDWYAQADDGAVWYFGEDVYNYDDGEVADTDGSWLAGRDGPPGMIMPASPQVGQAYRPENIPGEVFEEVTISRAGLDVDGPRGRVSGAIVGRENHLLEGHYEDKTFAPGYGEFRSGVGGNLEALAVAVPTDAASGPIPPVLTTVERAAHDVFTAAGAGDWAAADAALSSAEQAWAAHRADGNPPPLLAAEIDRALAGLAGDGLMPAVTARNAEGARRAAIVVGLVALDLQLPYRPVIDIDKARFIRWLDQVAVDTGSDEVDPGQVMGDAATLKWVADRILHTLDAATARDAKTRLTELRRAADDEDAAAAAKAAEGLRRLLEDHQ